jgi:hypothetical protein
VSHVLFGFGHPFGGARAVCTLQVDGEVAFAVRQKQNRLAVRRPDRESVHATKCHAVVAHLHVRGFQVAVNDALLVRGLERLGYLLRDRDGFVDWDRTLSDVVGERRPCDQFHHEADVIDAPLEPVNLRDVRMIQRREDFGFTLKSGETFGVGNERVG